MEEQKKFTVVTDTKYRQVFEIIADTPEEAEELFSEALSDSGLKIDVDTYSVDQVRVSGTKFIDAKLYDPKDYEEEEE